jgi:hypothetical protein
MNNNMTVGMDLGDRNNTVCVLWPRQSESVPVGSRKVYHP